MSKDGKAVIIDVRPREQFNKGHCEGAVSVPLYQSLDWSNGQVLAKALKWAAYSFNGVRLVVESSIYIGNIEMLTHY